MIKIATLAETIVGNNDSGTWASRGRTALKMLRKAAKKSKELLEGADKFVTVARKVIDLAKTVISLVEAAVQREFGGESATA